VKWPNFRAFIIGNLQAIEQSDLVKRIVQVGRPLPQDRENEAPHRCHQQAEGTENGHRDEFGVCDYVDQSTPCGLRRFTSTMGLLQGKKLASHWPGGHWSAPLIAAHQYPGRLPVSTLDTRSTIPSGFMVSVPCVTPQALHQGLPISPLVLE
jgi:hypothetical protein